MDGVISLPIRELNLLLGEMVGRDDWARESRSFDRVEKGQVRTEAVHCNHGVAPQPDPDVPGVVLKYHLMLRDREGHGDRLVDRRRGQEKVSAGEAGWTSHALN